MTVRPLRPDERDRLYRLTHDLSREPSLTRHVVACKRDPKLRRGRHFVLEAADGTFLSTLTAYPFAFPPVATAVGLANVFTPPSLRRLGHASRLISGVIDHWEAAGELVFYLLSDIGPAYYEPHGFRPLPIAYDAAPACVPMLRCPLPDWPRLSTHGPFLRGLMAFVD